MRANKAAKLKPRKRTAVKIVKLILTLTLVTLLLAVLLLPVFISSDKGRQIILAKINGAIPGKADFASSK